MSIEEFRTLKIGDIVYVIIDHGLPLPVKIHKVAITSIDEDCFSYKATKDFYSLDNHYTEAFSTYKETLENIVRMEEYRLKIAQEQLSRMLQKELEYDNR